MTGDIALEALAMAEPTRLQMLEDDYQEADRRFGLELLRYMEGDQSPEQAHRVELARQAWRRACDELEVERMAAKAADELPF